MEKIAKFEKVSYDQFRKDWLAFREDSEEEIQRIYDDIQLPQRATSGSAGYDFFVPCDLVLSHKEVVKVPTGIRARIAEGYVLMLFPRSGLGAKYGFTLNNTVGIIDADYYGADNEGHILCPLTLHNEDKVLELPAGKGMLQGIFLPFGITEDDHAEGVRTGGFGSTTK